MKKINRILALLLVAALIMQLPMTALATSADELARDSGTIGEGGEIIAFDTLPEEMANQTVTLGSPLEDLNLPNTLNATVRVATASDTEALEPEADGEQPEPESDKPEQAPAEPETMEVNIPIPAKWVASPDYDGEKTGANTFTAQIEGFTVSTAPPSITVTVGDIPEGDDAETQTPEEGTAPPPAPADKVSVTAFDALAEDIRWQNTPTPIFPETVGGTVAGQAVQILVTWQTEQDYDANAPEHGLYVFDAVPGEGYTLAGGAIAPRITVYIPEMVSRFAPFRMGGGGTETSRLEITTAAQLAEIAVLVNAGRLESFLLNDANATVSLKLMNDLDLSAYGQGYNGGEGWVPIGTVTKPFKGHFDGGGKVITGLYISYPGMDYLGLFGYIKGGRVQYLGLKDVHIVGGQRVGGVAGYVRYNGTVQNCYVSGSISGTYSVGGVVGGAYTSSTVQDCYANGSVSGTDYVGGVVGDVFDGSTVQNCYATVNVSGIGLIGGVAGLVHDGSTVQNCAALNLAVSGSHYVGRVVGNAYGEITLSGNAALGSMTVTVEDSPKAITSDAASFDGADIGATAIKADGTIGGRFTEDNGWIVANDSLPGFGAVVAMPDYITGGTDLNFLGAGTAASPFLIDTAEKLAKLAELVNNPETNATYGGLGIYYKLTADIDLSGYSASNTGFNNGMGWEPIGTFANMFCGDFDGGCKTIIGLYINDPALSYAGLFGYVSGGTVENLALQAVNINSGSISEVYAAAGGVAACVAGSGSIQKCSVSGQINSYWHVGGVVGKALGNSTAVKHCLVSVSVSGYQYVGGVVGYAEYAIIQSCYSTGDISNGTYPNAGSYAGGIAGTNFRGTIKDCAALNSKISAKSFAGRIEGWYDAGTALTDNVAFDWILDKINNQLSPNDHSTGIDGAARTADALQSASGFPPAFTTDPWTYTPGALPGLFGKGVEMPAHITNKLTSFFGGGDGTSAETAYQISTAAQLAQLAELVNDGNADYNSKYYQLTADIDLSGYGTSNTGFNGGKGWVPIGTKTNKFQGHFDGNHKTITGLYINDADLQYTGLLGNIEGGSVQKLCLTGVNIVGYSSVGGIAGEIKNDAIKVCTVSGSIRGTASGGAYVGGVIGLIDANGKVENCYSTGSVSGNFGSANIGGIAGCLTSGTSSVQNCYSTVEAKGSSRVGGIVGATWSYDSVIKNCAALNPAISEGATNGRVVGRDIVPSPGKLTGNRAFSGMIGGGSYKTADGTDGADISVSQIFDASFWKTAGNWNAGAWDSSVWTIANDKLPILTGFALGVQSGDGGLYLIDRDIANATVDAGGPYTYNGSAIEPSLTVSFDGETLVKDKDYTALITSIDGEGTSAGTKAGTVELALTGKSNFKGEKIGVTYTIQPKALTADMLTIPDGPFIYAPGVPQMPTPTVMDGGKLLVVDTDYMVAYSNGIYAGPANVEVTGKGNYTGVITKNFTVEKATPEALIWPNASEITYGTALSDSSLSDGSTTGTWAWTIGTTLPPVGTAGYEVTFTPDDITNYDWSGVTLQQNVSITVNKASGLTVSTQPSMNAREGVTRIYEFDMDNIALNKADTGAKTHSAEEGTDANSILSNVQVSGSKLTYTISNTAAIGNTASVAITISTANYEDATTTLAITVTPKDTQTIGFVDSTVTKTYGDAKFTQTAALQGAGGTGQITYASDNTAVATVDATTGEVTIAGTGSANITATKAADDDWYAATAVYGLTVNKKTVIITAHDKTVKAKQSQPEYTYEMTGLISGDSLTTEPTVTCPAADMNTPGTYAIVPSGAATSANYTIQYQNGALTVSPLSMACDVMGVTSPTDSAISDTSITGAVTYSVSSQLIGVTVSADAAWALYSDASCTTEITNKTMTLSVGASTAYIKVTAEDGTTAKIYTVTITRAASKGGHSSGGGSFSGGTSGDTMTTTIPGKTPEQPVMAAVPVTAMAGAGGSASAAIPDKSITDAISKAQANAKAQGKTINGIGIALNVNMPEAANSLSLTLSQAALQSLISANIQSLEIGSGIASLNLDLEALKEIQRQSTGSVTITIKPLENLPAAAKNLIGTRPVYDVTINYIKDGKTINVTSLGSGTATLSIPYTPGKNEAVGYLFGVYVDAKGKAQRISGSAYDVNSRSLLIPTGHLSVYGVGYTAPSAKFTDIGNHWGEEAIDYVVGKGLLSGTSETTFAPNTAMTREMLVTALGRLAVADAKAYTTNSFTDIKADSAFRPYIEWAYKNGVVQGIGNQQFAPDRAITREEIAIIFANYAKSTGYKLPVTREATAYADASSIGSVYKTAVTAMQQAGIMMGGTDNRFNPESNATRAEVSSLLHRYIKLTINPATAQGWAKNDAGQYLYYKDGKPLVGWQTLDGMRYFFNTNGTLQTSWVKDGDNWRFYDRNRALTVWWDIDSGDTKKTYYFNKDGLMVSGKWLQLDNKWYYFNADGSLARNSAINGTKSMKTE